MQNKLEERLRKYLDMAIRNWRKRKEEAVDELEEHTAACYIDAFQSVRVSILGELLLKDDK